MVFTGCDALFGPKVDEVDPADLADFEGDALGGGSPTEDDVVALGLLAGMSAGGLAEAVEADEDFNSEVSELMGTEDLTFGAGAFSSLVKSLMQENTARTFSHEGEITDDTWDFTFTIENESYNAADVYGGEYPDAAGTGTIVLGEIIAGLDITAMDEETGYGTGEGSGELTTDVSYDGWTMDGETIINAAQINSEGSAEFSATVGAGADEEDYSDDTYSYEWDIAYALSAGISVTSPEGSGKFIIDFTYNESDEVAFTYDDLMEDGFDSIVSDVEASLTITVYDNTDTQIGEFTWTSDELIELGEEEL